MEANEDPLHRGDQRFDRALRRVVERSNSPSPHPQNTCSYHINWRPNVKRLLTQFSIYTTIFSYGGRASTWSPPAPSGRRLDLMRASPPRRGGECLVRLPAKAGRGIVALSYPSRSFAATKRCRPVTSRIWFSSSESSFKSALVSD